jgi:hypothetical protein
MSYRKITVDGTEYEYTIGKTHVKVKGVGVGTNESVGENIPVPYGDAHYETTETLAVKPSHVVAFIRKNVKA